MVLDVTLTSRQSGTPTGRPSASARGQGQEASTASTSRATPNPTKARTTRPYQRSICSRLKASIARWRRGPRSSADAVATRAQANTSGPKGWKATLAHHSPRTSATTERVKPQPGQGSAVSRWNQQRSTPSDTGSIHHAPTRAPTTMVAPTPTDHGPKNRVHGWVRAGVGAPTVTPLFVDRWRQLA